MIESSREINIKYQNQWLNKNEINFRLFDINEKILKDNLVTWNGMNGCPIFAEDKKNHKVKKLIIEE